jgi:hypothetical protein
LLKILDNIQNPKIHDSYEMKLVSLEEYCASFHTPYISYTKYDIIFNRVASHAVSLLDDRLTWMKPNPEFFYKYVEFLRILYSKVTNPNKYLFISLLNIIRDSRIPADIRDYHFSKYRTLFINLLLSRREFEWYYYTYSYYPLDKFCNIEYKNV